MNHRTCSIEGCAKPVKHRGWCGMHYQRWQRHGDPCASTIARHPTLEASFAANLPDAPDENGCLLWKGSLTAAGYGRVQARGDSMYAHRYAWEQVHGELGPSELVDHVCHQTQCVNVAHLRIATRAENGQNRAGSPSSAAIGVRGVSRKRNGYRARVGKGGVEHCAGTFPTIEEAAQAAEKLRAELFGEFAGRG